MTARSWPLSVLGGRWYESARERVRAFYYWLSLRHPWAWRVRLDLVLALNLFLALLSLLVGVVTTRMAEPGSASNLAFNIIVPPAVGAGLYWAYAVLKGVRVRSAARFGAAPGPVLGVAVCLSFGCWAIAAIVRPYIYVERDAYVGTSLPEFESGMSTIYSVQLEWTPDDSARRVRRQDFVRGARPAVLWSALTFDIRKPRWFADTYEHRLSSALREFAKLHDPWKSRLAALPRWRSPYPVLADLRLRREFPRSVDFESAVVASWIERNIWYVMIPIGEGALDDPRNAPPESLATRFGEEIAGAPRLRPLFVEFDQAVAAGSVKPPPSFPPGVWLKLREMQFEDFAMTLSGRDSGIALTDKLKEAVRHRFDRLESDAQARGEYLRSEAYKTWRLDLARRLAEAGAFDKEIKGTDSFQRAADAWQDALREPASAPEMMLQQNLTEQLRGYMVGLLAVLLLGVFAASISRAGMVQTLVSIGLFVAVSGAIGGAALAVYYAAIQGGSAANDESMLLYALLFVFAVLIALTPLAVSLIRRRHTRWSVPFALAAVWGVAAFTPFVVLGQNIFESSRYYYGGPAPSYVRDFLPAFPNELAGLLFQVVLWLAIAVAFAALVHALLARLAALPRPS